jgi:hypothetical protein
MTVKSRREEESVTDKEESHKTKNKQQTNEECRRRNGQTRE